MFLFARDLDWKYAIIQLFLDLDWAKEEQISAMLSADKYAADESCDDVSPWDWWNDDRKRLGWHFNITSLFYIMVFMVFSFMCQFICVYFLYDFDCVCIRLGRYDGITVYQGI